MERYDSSADYLAALASRGAMPPGFGVATAATAFEPPERPGNELPIRVTLLMADEPADAFAATLTRNTLRGAPVQIVADLLARRAPVRGVVINNAVSNVGVATGVDDAHDRPRSPGRARRRRRAGVRPRLHRRDRLAAFRSSRSAPSCPAWSPPAPPAAWCRRRGRS